MTRGIERVVAGGEDMSDGRAETRSKVFLAGLVEPLDEHALVTAREQKRSLGREPERDDRQRVPMENTLRGFAHLSLLQRRTRCF